MRKYNLKLKASSFPVKKHKCFLIAAGEGLFYLGDAMKLTQERLKKLLHYDPETGVFVRVVRKGSRGGVGRIAGCIRSDGYRVIKIDYNSYLASRLAFLYVRGYFPEHEADHINRVRNDDRWCNLRHISHRCNLRNSNISKRNKTGITGVCWHKAAQKWHARIHISYKNINLGLFINKLDAAKARWNAEVKYGFPDCNTISTAFLYLQENESQ